ncbi:2-haloalkanoic acid dehalogenase type II [Haloactinospora alba]|uniref:2-haloalkanoic acid dehalogenase type II n=2 Tax=Haloactinospora alba TaxID=405555 RepID=A0A543NJW4_9ACTN|nr:haloacid dehalogenase type II [Haloactinospora alba]TQN32155.1 2-haloalkanoic acid dehalogenase type II [Haloactinospora alba]
MQRPLKALLFDVQGTAVDFHSTVCGEARRISAGRCPDTDWARFVDRWRAAYFAATGSAEPDRGNWVTVHSTYRQALDRLLGEDGITVFSDAEREELTLAWQKLAPWPDTVEGLNRLRARFTLATLSNTDVAAVVHLSKRAGLPWDAIFNVEMAGAFKPHPSTYRMATTYLGLVPAEVMMVACHKYDLRAAASLGFRTAFVARPLEFGPAGASTCAMRRSSASTPLTSSISPTNLAADTGGGSAFPPEEYHRLSGPDPRSRRVTDRMLLSSAGTVRETCSSVSRAIVPLRGRVVRLSRAGHVAGGTGRARGCAPPPIRGSTTWRLPLAGGPRLPVVRPRPLGSPQAHAPGGK